MDVSKQVDLCQNCYKIWKQTQITAFERHDPNRSQLTGDPFAEDFFKPWNFQVHKNLKPSNSIWRQLWRWRLRPNTTVTASRPSSSPSSKAKRTIRRILHQCHRNCPQGDIWPCHWPWWRNYPCHRNSQPSKPKNNRFWLENLGSKKLPLWKAWLKKSSTRRSHKS